MEEALKGRIDRIVNMEAEAARAALVNGRHFCTYVNTVKALKRAGKWREAELLVGVLVVAAARWAAVMETDPPPWYAAQLGIIQRKLAKLTHP